MNFSNEQIIKARGAKSASELLELAKSSGVDLSEDQAKRFFVQLHAEGELSDDELATVAGGSKDPTHAAPYSKEQKVYYKGKSLWVTVDSYWWDSGVDKWSYCVKQTVNVFNPDKTYDLNVSGCDIQVSYWYVYEDELSA